MQQECGNDAALGAYTFSYISKNEFESIFKHVKRERRKKHDEKAWERFLTKKQEKRATLVQEKNSEKEIDQIKERTPQEYVDPDSCKKYCTVVPPAQQSPKMECGQHRHSLQKSVDHPQPEPNEAKPDCQECGCHSLGPSPGHAGNHGECAGQKVPSAENNKLYEITNFDEEFKRVEELRDKIVFALRSIETALSQESYKSLDEEEMIRCRLRSSEFAARFKRNYHYQITRQINEIKKLNSNESWKKTSIPAAVKKFKSSHQVAVQGLQAVEKHLRSTSDNSPHLWFQEFLSSICEMETLFSSVFECDNDQDQIAFRNACSAIALQLDSMANRHKREPEAKKKKKKHAAKRNDVKDNLWMYRSHKDWKSKASELARVKLAKINRKKAEMNEQGDRLDDKPAPPAPDNLQELKMEVKQREGASLRKHVRSMKEDQVRTMMEIVPDATDSDHEEEKLDVEPTKEVVTTLPAPKYVDQRSRVNGSARKTPSTDAKQTPNNVSLVCVVSEVESPPPTLATSASGAGESGSRNQALKTAGNMAGRYRTALQAYQRKMKWYDPKIIGAIDRMTETIYDELIGAVASEINIDHIIKNLIDLEMRR